MRLAERRKWAREMRCLCLFLTTGWKKSGQRVGGQEMRVHDEPVARPTQRTPERSTISQPCMCICMCMIQYRDVYSTAARESWCICLWSSLGWLLLLVDGGRERSALGWIHEAAFDAGECANPLMILRARVTCRKFYHGLFYIFILFQSSSSRSKQENQLRENG